MGISASQARLLTITARLTSNEYESQQISNAKMRLATQSEQASRDYIAALDTKQLQFMTYDAKGALITENLTAIAIYQYADMKNQYMLVNTSGQALVSNGDVKNFKSAGTLDEFLELYGINKVYKTETLAASAEAISENAPYYTAWEQAIENAKNADYTRNVNGEDKEMSGEEAYQIDKYNASIAYSNALEQYDKALEKYNAGLTGIDLDTPKQALAYAKQKFTDCMNFDTWAMAQAAYQLDDNGISQETEVHKNVMKYYDVLNDFLAEAETLGCDTVESTYTYNDSSKAQWYTNLWYRMNGDSSYKSAAGLNESNYTVLDSKLAASSQWVQDALTQGLISLEVVSNEDVNNVLNTELVSDGIKDQGAINNFLGNPLNLTLKGIKWTSTQYGSASEFIEKDDDVAIARAEAEYQRKNNEIAAKDKKYENKIKSLDTEHNALQTEYESVQSAMNKNIDRSYKTFNG